jgi:hypothetical protein
LRCPKWRQQAGYQAFAGNTNQFRQRRPVPRMQR